MRRPRVIRVPRKTDDRRSGEAAATAGSSPVPAAAGGVRSLTVRTAAVCATGALVVLGISASAPRAARAASAIGTSSVQRSELSASASALARGPGHEPLDDADSRDHGSVTPAPTVTIQALADSGAAAAAAAAETAAAAARQAQQALAAVPGTLTGPASSLDGGTGIPVTVLAAYRKAEALLAAAKPSCHLTWWLLAGIGRIESDHAEGGRVDPTGKTRGRILGPLLDGSLPGSSVIPDSDKGTYDGNTSFDRAVGPMQFLPSSWRAWGHDGNGDKVADPDNVFDAATSAGYLLCAAGDLSSPDALARAVLSYNHSMPYLAAVLAWGAAYRDGVVASPDGVGPVLSVPSAPAPAPTTAAPAPTSSTTPPRPPGSSTTTTSPPPAQTSTSATSTSSTSTTTSATSSSSTSSSSTSSSSTSTSSGGP